MSLFARLRPVTRSSAIALIALSVQQTSVAAVKVEAESGVLGAELSVTSGNPTYIAPVSDGAGGSPGSAARVASYSITFPTPAPINSMAGCG